MRKIIKKIKDLWEEWDWVIVIAGLCYFALGILLLCFVALVIAGLIIGGIYISHHL